MPFQRIIDIASKRSVNQSVRLFNLCWTSTFLGTECFRSSWWPICKQVEMVKLLPDVITYSASMSACNQADQWMFFGMHSTKVFFVEVWVNTWAARGVRTLTVSIGILYQSRTIVKQWNFIEIVDLQCSNYINWLSVLDSWDWTVTVANL